MRRLLDHAQRRVGASAGEMIDALGAFQVRGAATRRSWYDWHERPETVSALTAIAAVRILGPQAAIEVLFGAAGDSVTRGGEADHEVQQLRDEMDQLREQVASLQTQVDDLGGAGRGAEAPDKETDRLLVAVRDGLRVAAEELGLPWDEPPADATTDELAGILQGRMMETQGSLGLDWTSSSSIASDLVEIARDLTGQMEEVTRRVAERRKQHREQQPRHAAK